MPSHFSWIDFSEEDRQKMMDVVHLFAEHEARDELGIGTVRDAFAELFFPGTNTIQTRAKYFLFIPWTYRALEQKRVSSAKIAEAARRAEIRLIYALLAAGDKYGVMGQDIKDGLQRLPSAIYWNGLRTWGIQRFPGSREHYHRDLDSLYHRRRALLKGDDGEPVDGNSLDSWHPGLPDAPQGFPQIASMELTPAEAQYLQERIVTTHPNSMLARLAYWSETVDCDFPWEHPVLPSLPQSLRSTVAHARNFSEIIFGAALLYNLLLARALPDEELVSDYESLLEEWVALVECREEELRRWVYDKGFWNCLALRHARIPAKTRSFVDGWLSLTLGREVTVSSITSSEAAADLIRMREYMLKHNRARLHHRRALDRWGGNAGAFRLDYRWSTVKTILKDITDGILGGARSAQS